MEVVGFAKEAPDSPSGNFEAGRLTTVRKFKVQTNDLADGPLVVTAAPGIPRLYESYFFGNELQVYMLCRSMSAERLEPNSMWWEVIANYSTPEPKEPGGVVSPHGTGQEVSGQFTNPLLELAEVAFSTETVQVPVYGIYKDDGSSEACKNSAGEIYNPPPMMDQARLTMTITRNEPISSPHPVTSVLYQNTVNSDAWWGLNPGQARCKTITSSRQVKNLPNGVPFVYLKVVYSFSLLPTHDLQILDAGDFYLVSGKKTAFQDAQGNAYVGLLDGTGFRLSDGVAPVFKTFKVYPRQPFAPLNLPQSYMSSVQ